MSTTPKRIVCLSAEAADWLWRVGVWERVVGVTAFFTLPPDVPPKPRVSGFSSANIEQIARLNPDLVITYSDVQAGVAGALIHRRLDVLATNQRTLAEIEATLALLARVVGREDEGESLLCEFRKKLMPVAAAEFRPRVYFEEWNEPFISGIAWVSELIERAGGDDVFAGLRTCRAAPDRVVSSEQVCQAEPEIIFASWCGRPVQLAAIASRAGWQDLPAVRHQRVHEIRGEDILQPGFRLVYGYDQIKRLLQTPTCAVAPSH